ncbi:unnamed protein product [Phyllotreta striolata]|uniref:Prolylcarboxypeptidase n=1 Tax=Phyllotreta striolata TaxID=444603 RepID=A0A9N9TMD5_PHYSR|nr:unnamed protein product [Phyllotreta striolata]
MLLRFYPLSVVCCTINLVLSERFYALETRYIDVPVTHFDWRYQTDTFKLRYMVGSRGIDDSGPIFAYIGGSGDITVYSRNSGYVFEIAKAFKASVVFIEHRYYGRSFPFESDSLSKKNMRFLSTREVLADIVLVINHLRKSSTGEQRQVVAFGGGYGGTLAAWLRVKYPFLITGAIASSAPMAFSTMVKSCDCFYEKITEGFRRYGGEQCVRTIKLGWDVVINLSKTKLGLDFLSTTWKLCRDLKSIKDINLLLDWLTKVYVDLSVNNYHYPTDFFVPLPAYPVKLFCNKLTTSFANDTKGLIEYFGEALQIYTNYTRKVVCNEFETAAEYAFKFQRCAELVMPVCSVESDMFINRDWSYRTFSAECGERFGIGDATRDRVVREYGENLEHSSNVLFVNGEMDPYSCYSFSSNASASIRSFEILDGPHHVEMRSPDVSDNNYIVNARNMYVEAVRSWLKGSGR